MPLPYQNLRRTPPKRLRPSSALLPLRAQSQWYRRHRPGHRNRTRRATRMRSHSSITLPSADSIPLSSPPSRRRSSPILSSILRISWDNTKSIVSRCSKTMTVNPLQAHPASLSFPLPRPPSSSPLRPGPPRCRCLPQASQVLQLRRVLLRLQPDSPLHRLQPNHPLSNSHPHQPHLQTLNPRPWHRRHPFPASPVRHPSLSLQHQEKPNLHPP